MDAKEILAKTKATAEEIAIECGFGEVLRFRRAFKRMTGNTGALRWQMRRIPDMLGRERAAYRFQPRGTRSL